ncbi:Zuotin, partial [Basidiobolus ranarum]
REAQEKAAAEAKKKAEEEAIIAAQKAEEDAKLKAQSDKKAKEARKNAIRKEKKTIKRLMKDHQYFCGAEPSPDQVEEQLNKLELLFEKLAVEDLEVVRKKFEEAAGKGEVKSVFDQELSTNGI